MGSFQTKVIQTIIVGTAFNLNYKKDPVKANSITHRRKKKRNEMPIMNLTLSAINSFKSPKIENCWFFHTFEAIDFGIECRSFISELYSARMEAYEQNLLYEEWQSKTLIPQYRLIRTLFSWDICFRAPKSVCLVVNPTIATTQLILRPGKILFQSSLRIRRQDNSVKLLKLSSSQLDDQNKPQLISCTRGEACLPSRELFQRSHRI